MGRLTWSPLHSDRHPWRSQYRPMLPARPQKPGQWIAPVVLFLGALWFDRVIDDSANWAHGYTLRPECQVTRGWIKWSHWAEAVIYNQCGWVLQRHGIQTSKISQIWDAPFSTNLRVGGTWQFVPHPISQRNRTVSEPTTLLVYCQPGSRNSQTSIATPEPALTTKDCHVENQKPSGVTHGFSESHMFQPNSGWSHAHKNTRN